MSDFVAPGHGTRPTRLPPVLDETAMDRYIARFDTRAEMAIEYARLIEELGPGWHGWAVLNLAIMDHWSQSGLVYIKTRAWKLAHA